MALIGEYHGNVPDWRATTNTKAGDLFGIELEVEHSLDRQIAADAVDDIDYEGHPAPITERDGSLHRLLGVEIICPPLPMDNVMNEDGYIARLMRRLREVGVPDDQRQTCGMHINVNVVDWTPQEKLLVQWCLNAFNVVATHIGRRGGGGTFGSFLPVYQYRREVDGSLRADTFPGGKHSAAWLRSPGNGFPAGRGNALVLEARFPRSTLEIKELHAAIDYIMAVRDWVRAAPNHTQAAILLAQVAELSPVLQALFVRWCVRYRPHVNVPINPEEIDKVADLLGKGSRLEVTTRAYEKIERIRPSSALFAEGLDSKEQILRISTLVGKGVGLEGESAPARLYGAGTAYIDASSVRRRR
jgi:hypothetical protein